MGEVRCPNCGTIMEKAADGTYHCNSKNDGDGFLIPKKIENWNANGGSMDLSKLSDDELLKEMEKRKLQTFSAKDDDGGTSSVSDEINKKGFIRNIDCRRMIVAQTIDMLGWADGVKSSDTWTEKCNRMPYAYQFTMMLEEVRVLAKLQKTDTKRFNKRVRFFNVTAVTNILYAYCNDLQAYLTGPNKKVKKCKGIPYIRVRGTDIFVEDINKKIIIPLKKDIDKIRQCTNYEDVYKKLKDFTSHKKNPLFIRICDGHHMIPEWVDVYKGAGSYYTLLSLYTQDAIRKGNMSREDSIADLEHQVDCCSINRDFYKLLGELKEVLKQNQFVFNDLVEKTNRELGLTPRKKRVRRYY